jgi:triacylglycerol esterase/lipase EstA (alpha/beta hydrolase family)
MGGRFDDTTVAVGTAVGAAARWCGRQARAAWRAVDPDLRTHVAQLPLVGLTLLAGGRPGVRPLPDDGHRPVVFVHGLGGGNGNFAPARLFFRLHGRTRTYAPSLPAGLDLPALGVWLAGYLAEVVRANGLPPGRRIDLVAHSMGGLVARLALQDPAVAARVAVLVTMATPHAGSHLARYGTMPHSLALRPGSDVFARLAGQVPWAGPPALPRLVSLWSPADVILLPATSACLEGATNVELPGLTHYAWLIQPRPWAAALDALDVP